MRGLVDWPEYWVDNMGYVYRVLNRRGNYQEPRQVKPWKTLAGYYQVYFSRGKIRRVISIHRLVALLYIPNPDNLPQVNHIDGDKMNNKVTNLEWCSPKQNIKSAVLRGSFSNHGDMKLLDGQVLALRDRRQSGETLSSLAKVFNVSIRYVQQLVNNEYRKDLTK
jgi:hypothetical protein